MELEAGGVPILVLTVIVALWSLAAPWSNAGELDSLSVFYFGNSLTGNTMPTLHGELGRSAGKRWLVERSQGAGWQVWQHLYLDSRRSHRERLASGGWDAIVVQPFGSRLFDEMITEMWQGKVSFDEPTNLGDLHCTAGLVELLLKGNPDGRALVYSDWPGMKLEVTREQNRLSKDLKHAERWHQIMEPFRRSFDYEAAWLTEYDEEAAAEKVPWKREGVASRSHDYQLMDGLRKKFAHMWREGRLELIPVGDVFFALDRKIRNGHLEGLQGIGDYYTNGVHIRSGLPRYTTAATFYAVLFRQHPRSLDWRIYDERANYLNTDGWVCCQKDLGVHLDITEKRAEAVNETIWDVVTNHPYTHLNARADSDDSGQPATAP
ncbi:MAG: hypothetical protein R6X33_11245 [Candidatus Brocadiia bacterium]